MRGDINSDVDGVVADLMGRDGHGFAAWCRKKGIGFDPELVGNLRVTGENRKHLLDFLREPHSYMDWVNPIPGAAANLRILVTNGFRLSFVTSITEEPRQYPAKNEWLEHHFGDIEFETSTIPSRDKHRFAGDYMIDDRADTIWRFLGTPSRRGLFLFEQPWNFAYGDEVPGAIWRDPSAWGILSDSLESARRMGIPRVPFLEHTADWKLIREAIEADHG